jgi:SPP1 gp7 family putative phage head morphogenesis protein
VSGGRSSLELALSSGRLTFNRGVFSGSFNLTLTKELKAIGAKWDPATGTYRLLSDDLPPELKAAVAISESAFKRKAGKISERIEKVLGSSPWETAALSKVFESAVFQMSRDFRENVSTISIQPEESDFQIQQIAREYTSATKREIGGFTQNEMFELRQKVHKAYLAGDRYGSLEKMIQDSYGVSARRADFIARQEMNLLTAEYQGSKYVEVGLNYYRWVCVPGTTDHPTRHRHKELSAMSDKGILFRWDDPPVTTERNQPARKNNPRQDYNCRCDAHPVVVPAGMIVVPLGNSRYQLKAA